VAQGHDPVVAVEPPRERHFLALALSWFVMSERLKGKIGIVTGAGTGIGRGCV